MNEKEEGILLGELKAFREEAIKRLECLESKVDALDKFKVKVTVIMASVVFIIELCWRVYQAVAG